MTDTTQQIAHVDDGTTSVEVSISIEAPVEVVFDFLTVPEKALRWMGHDGEIDPRPGGMYRVRFTDDDIAVGEYVEITPHTHRVMAWGWQGNDGIPPGSTLVTFTLSAGSSADSTVVTVNHTGLPTSPQQQHTAAVGASGADDWVSEPRWRSVDRRMGRLMDATDTIDFESRARQRANSRTGPHDATGTSRNDAPLTPASRTRSRLRVRTHRRRACTVSSASASCSLNPIAH